MATFTLTLAEVMEIEPDIGLDSYPIFDETYRDVLNGKIIDQFLNREIGQETIELFRHALRRKMNQIMPLYNQHYLASQIQFDPLSTVNLKTLANTAGTSGTTGTSDNTATSGSKSRAVASDFPQVALSGNGDYASSASDNVSDTTSTGTASEESTTTENAESDSTTTGYQGHAPELLFRYRQTLVNVDMMILDELETLFMLVWSNGDEFTERAGVDYYPYWSRF